MFGRIRNLQPEIQKNIYDMPSINYDITKDSFFLEGVKIAEKAAREKDIAGIKDLLIDGHFTQKQIAAIIRVPLSLVRKVKKELDAEK